MAFTERKIGQGRSAEVIQISETEALKLFHEGYEPAFIRHEFEVSAQVARYCDFAPEVFSMDIRGGRTGIRFELIEGIEFYDLLRQDTFAVKDLGSALGVLHRGIHNRQWGTLPEGSQVFSRIVRETGLLSPSEKPDYLNLVWDRSRETLCHGDFHPFNTLYEKAPNKKEGFRVFDWSHAYIGHPLSDVARTLFLITRAKLPSSCVKRVPILLKPFYRRLLAAGYMRAYFGAAPVPWELLSGWGVLVRIMRLDERVQGEGFMLRMGIKTLKRRFALGTRLHKDKRL